MRAAALDALRYEDVAVPSPGRGEALVKIAAAGVNFIDVQHRTGRYPPPALPFTLGSEGAGTVTAVGSEVAEVQVGDRVAYAMVTGSYAELRSRAGAQARRRCPRTSRSTPRPRSCCRA